MLHSRTYQIDPGSLNGTVTQHVSQLHDILAYFIKGHGEQVAQVVGEHPRAFHARRFSQLLHLPPDLPSGQSLSAFRPENLAGSDFPFPDKPKKFAAELSRQEDNAHLAL